MKRLRQITSITALLAFALAPAALLGAAPDSGRVPVNIPVKSSRANGMDISFLNNAPAGAHGFIRATPDGHFANDKGRVKFVGIAIVGTLCFPNRAEADEIAGYLARHGVNLVRFHFFMNYLLAKDKARANGYFAALDYFIHALNRRGIYIDLDLYDLYQISPPGIVPDGGRFKPNDFFFYSKAIEAQKYYASLVFNHVNPHTKRAYKDESGIAFAELLNENSPFWGDTLQKCAGESKAELEKLFIAWVEKNAISAADYKALLADPAKPLAPGNITFPSVYDSEAMKEFSVALMLRYYRSMKTFLGTLGARIPLTGHNCPLSPADFYTLARTMDYTCSHFYWTHSDKSSLKTPLNHFWTLPPQLGRVRNAGMPAIVNEFSYSHPNKYRSEGLPELMAYGALQDLDALVLFSYHDEWPKFMKNGKPAQGSWETPNEKLRYHSNLVKDPAIWPLVPALALSFRQGMVRPAENRLRITSTRDEAVKRETRERRYTKEQMDGLETDSFYSRQLLASSEETYKKVISIARAYDKTDTAQLLAFTSRVEREFTPGPGGFLYNADGGPSAPRLDIKPWRISYLPVDDNSNFTAAHDSLRRALAKNNIKIPAVENGVIASDTGEIRRDFANGVLSVDTPRLVVRSGFIQGDNAALGGTLAFAVGNEHLSAAIVSGDAKELASARTVYVLFGVNAGNSGEKPAKMKDFHIGSDYGDGGEPPIMADALAVSLSWKRTHAGYRVFAEDPDKAEYQLLAESKAGGDMVSFTCLKNAYRYKIVFD
ncbi:hypothetical protein OH491_22210 [Termitidicoccus mucosus]